MSEVYRGGEEFWASEALRGLRGERGDFRGGETKEVREFLESGEHQRVFRVDKEGEKLRIRVVYRVAKGEELKLDYRAIVTAKGAAVEILASGVVEGKKETTLTVELRKGAKGSKGVVKDDVILVGEKARNISRPIILSAEKDAVGRHGAAVGRIDERAVSYLGTRGITRQKAREMLVKAKLAGAEAEQGEGS